jgi:rhodanese-related sulfurtransferase
MKVHRLVWLTWVGPTNDLLILHNDDDKNNNALSNLRLGSQKDNIADCFMNDHRVGNVDHITVYDKKTKQTLTFSPMKEFITYCGHPSKSGSVKKFFNKNWFKKRYTIIDYGKGKV